MPTKTIAFFGATGDCAGHTLALALKAGHSCVALARTPAKLTKSMLAKGVEAKALDANLTIVQGNVREVEDVKKALQLDGRIVDLIVSGIGAAPVFQWSLIRPVTISDPTICEAAAETIVQALKELAPAPNQRPTVINFSTTGIVGSDKPRDVPLLFVFLYHVLLATPHKDKKLMEEVYRKQVQLPENECVIRNYVMMRASLLMDGEGKGVDKVRFGTDDSPAVGYTIQRKDVGAFTFEKLIEEEPRTEWLNGGVSITY